VASARQLTQYFENEAKAWETLAFNKMRLVAGAAPIAEQVSKGLDTLRKRFAALPEFVSKLRAMRKRIEDSVRGDSFKTGPGGLYDMDFLLGLLEARAGLESAGKQFPTRLGALVERELLSLKQGQELLHAAELFRRVDHAIRIVEGRSRKWLPESEVLRANVEKIAGCPDLPETLRAEMAAVRSIFESFFYD
jgi:glutamate-ammonia-ligase adenylyltransferase